MKLTDFNEALLGPVLASALTNLGPGVRLATASVNAALDTKFAVKGESSAKGDITLTRFLLSDPKNTLPTVPMDLRVTVDGSFEQPVTNQMQITVRKRGAPLDLIVAEAAIVANSTWGSWLAELGVPGIYRSQASLAPGVKVRMGTKALPHAGMGVAQYTWATSPLRRYTDLVNQWQLIAAARHGATAALASGKARLIAVLDNDRDPKWPAVESVTETYRDFERTADWTGVFGPAGMPPQLVSRLNGEVNTILRQKEMEVRLQSDGLAPAGGTPGELYERVRRELDQWRQVIQRAGIKIN